MPTWKQSSDFDVVRFKGDHKLRPFILGKTVYRGNELNKNVVTNKP